MIIASAIRAAATRTRIGFAAALASVVGGVAAATTDAERRHDQAMALLESSERLLALGDAASAVAVAREGQPLLRGLLAAEPGNMVLQHDLALGDTRLGDALAAQGQVEEALTAYRDGAHALMFVGRVEEARRLYLQAGSARNVEDERSGKTVILEDFAELRKAGLTRPLMDEIERQLAQGE